MTYAVGDQLRVAQSTPGNYFAAGEIVTVRHVEDDGTPTVEIAPTDEQPAGRATRVPPELEEYFEPA
jgi:hypothetical protein